jgi:hypothetical protein
VSATYVRIHKLDRQLSSVGGLVRRAAVRATAEHGSSPPLGDGRFAVRGPQQGARDRPVGVGVPALGDGAHEPLLERDRMAQLVEGILKGDPDCQPSCNAPPVGIV